VGMSAFGADGFSGVAGFIRERPVCFSGVARFVNGLFGLNPGRTDLV